MAYYSHGGKSLSRELIMADNFETTQSVKLCTLDSIISKHSPGEAIIPGEGESHGKPINSRLLVSG